MKRWVPLIFVILSAVVLLVGLFLGDVGAVWGKAAYVCLECIGIG